MGIIYIFRARIYINICDEVDSLLKNLELIIMPCSFPNNVDLNINKEEMLKKVYGYNFIKVYIKNKYIYLLFDFYINRIEIV